jgi:hypothetical protein
VVKRCGLMDVLKTVDVYGIVNAIPVGGVLTQSIKRINVSFVDLCLCIAHS